MADVRDKEITTGALADAYRQCIAHMKTSFPIWEDFLMRGMKLHRSVEHTIAALNGFIEGLGKVADIAARGKAGGTSDIGAGLSLLVTWHRAQEFKIKEMNTALSVKLLAPLHSKVEEWKRTTTQMDRDHEKEVHRTVKEIKESNKSTLKTHKHMEAKLKKDKMEKASILQHQLEQQKKDGTRLLIEAEEREKENLGKVLLEERRWYSGFVAGFSKPLDVEVSMFGDVERLKVIMADLSDTISQPSTLPVAAKEYVERWSLPVASSSPSHRRRPSLHNSSASLTSSHSHSSSLGSQDSINITAPVQAHSIMPSGSVAPPTVPPTAPVAPTAPGTSQAQLVDSPMVPAPPIPPPNSQYEPVQYAQTNFGADCTTHYSSGTPPPPAPPPAPPAPPGGAIAPPPPAPPQYSQYQHPQMQQPPQPAPQMNYQQPAAQYQQPQQPPAAQQYGGQYQQPYNSLPPPPPPNFPPTPEMCYDQVYHQNAGSNPASVVYDDNFEPVGQSSLSVSPSQASLSSHYSSESGRSLSPPVGPTRPPGSQNKAHLSSLQETPAEAGEASDLQSALMSKLRQRTNSVANNNSATNGHARGDFPPSLPRTSSLGSRQALSTSSITHKPPRAPPTKPTRSMSFAHNQPPPQQHGLHMYQQQNHTPNVPPYGAGSQPPHHNIMVSARTSSMCSSDSDPEEESAFAKALRLKKLKKTNSATAF